MQEILIRLHSLILRWAGFGLLTGCYLRCDLFCCLTSVIGVLFVLSVVLVLHSLSNLVDGGLDDLGDIEHFGFMESEVCLIINPISRLNRLLSRRRPVVSGAGFGFF